MHMMGRPHVLHRGYMRGSPLCSTAATIRSKSLEEFHWLSRYMVRFALTSYDKNEAYGLHNQNRAELKKKED